MRIGKTWMRGFMYSKGHHPGYSVTRLFGEEVFPVCSPQFRKTLSARPCADEVFGQPLLHDIYWNADWPDWARAVGATAGELAANMRFALYKGVIQAAVDGMGMAVGHGEMVAKELATGKLVPLAASLGCFREILSPDHERFVSEQSNPRPVEGMAPAGMRRMQVVERLTIHEVASPAPEPVASPIFRPGCADRCPTAG